MALIAATTSPSAKWPASFGYATVEDNLEQQIAEFILEIGYVVARDRIDDFMGFLDRIGRDRREILREVPFASVLRITQARHDCHQPLDHA